MTDVLVSVFDDELMPESLKLATLLRQNGVRTEVYFRAARISAQIKYADNRGIPYVAILGSDEVESGTVAIRNLATREQQTVAREEVVARIQEELWA